MFLTVSLIPTPEMCGEFLHDIKTYQISKTPLWFWSFYPECNGHVNGYKNNPHLNFEVHACK